MNGNALLEHVGIKINGLNLPEIVGIAIRASDVRQGFAFMALKGLKQDGADFIPEAEKNGAVLILAEREVSASVPVIVVPDLKEKVAALATVVYPSDKMVKVAVTGTNGKTSTVFYVQQLLNKLGISAASLGTVGVDRPNQHQVGQMTTPDAVTLNKTLHELQNDGVRVVALEASSHGLEQGRLGGITFQAGAFTNLTQDHLDYHKTMDAYFSAKSKLFTDYLNETAVAVLNADDPVFDKLKAIAENQQKKIISYGWKGTDFKLVKQTPLENGQDVIFRCFEKEYHVHLNIVGDFQVMNLFAALGLCLGVGVSVEELIPLLAELKAPVGRVEWMGDLPNGASVFVDYAHTPDAVERVLLSLRNHTKGRLVCLLGCGGNRDTTKRPLMGEAANRLADVVYVTDDNPRYEKPADIRKAVLSACPKGIEIDNREEAIHRAVAGLQENDVLVVAGKGHEVGQIIQGITYAMDDRMEVRLALLKYQKEVLWSAAELSLALSVPVSDRIVVYGVSIDTRTLALGDMFIALKGEKMDGHDFVKKAVELGASVCIVDHLVDEVPVDKQIVVSDTFIALENLARFARMRSSAKIIGVTGSSGKTTTKEMIASCLAEQGKTHATSGNLNNQIGVPLTLVRMPSDTQYAVIEMGMNHTGELMKLSGIVHPDVSIITSIGMAHREFFADETAVARAKSEIFDFQNRQGTVVLNRDCSFFTFLKQVAEQQNIQHILSFGEHKQADMRLISADTDGVTTKATILWNEKTIELALHFIGVHFVKDALGALLVIQAIGGDVERALSVLEKIYPQAGRGQLSEVLFGNKKIDLIDDAYNANPSSMMASLTALGYRQGGRKIAILGDMLELGAEALDMHLSLLPAILQSGVDKVYTVGPIMAKLLEKLPTEKQGRAVSVPEELFPVLETELSEKDIVLVKSSHGTGLYRLIHFLKGCK